MHCFNHPEADAVAVCRTCGRAICRSCVHVSDAAVTCSEACQARAEALAKQLATSAALTASAQRFTHVTPRIYLLLACALLAFGLIIASLTRNRLLAAIGPVLWVLAAFCFVLALGVALSWWKLRGRDFPSVARAE